MHERSIENKNFCSLGFISFFISISVFSLAESRYEKKLVSRGLKKTKEYENFLKKSSQIEFKLFFKLNFPMSPELVFLSPFVH